MITFDLSEERQLSKQTPCNERHLYSVLTVTWASGGGLTGSVCVVWGLAWGSGCQMDPNEVKYDKFGTFGDFWGFLGDFLGLKIS